MIENLSMLKYFIALAILFSVSIAGYSQDQIILQNGQVIKAKVLSSQPSLITYQQAGSDSVVVLNKSAITVILYENGFSDVISKGRGKGKNAVMERYPENRISMDWLSFAGREVSFQFERVIGNGNIAIRVPVGLVYNTGEFNYIIDAGRRYWDFATPLLPNQYLVVEEGRGRGFRSGVSLVAYLNDAKKVRAYLAPGIVAGYFSSSTDYEVVTYNQITGQEISRVRNTSKDGAVFLGTDVMLGFTYLPTRNLSMAFETGGGFGTFIPELGSRTSSGIWRASLLIGYNWPKK